MGKTIKKNTKAGKKRIREEKRKKGKKITKRKYREEKKN